MNQIYKSDQLITCSVCLKNEEESFAPLCMQIMELRRGRWYERIYAIIKAPLCFRTELGY